MEYTRAGARGEGQVSRFAQYILPIASSPPSAPDPDIHYLVSFLLGETRIDNQIPSKAGACNTSMVWPHPYLLPNLQLCLLMAYILRIPCQYAMFLTDPSDLPARSSLKMIPRHSPVTDNAPPVVRLARVVSQRQRSSCDESFRAVTTFIHTCDFGPLRFPSQCFSL